MTETPGILVSWQARETPLAPLAVAGQGDAALALAGRLLACDDEALARIKGVAAERLLIAIGDEADLPWVDGVIYLGRDDSAPSLLLPTTRQPDVPLALFERAVIRHGQGAAPLAVLLAPAVVAPVSAARAISREQLRTWLAAATRTGPKI